MKQLFTPDPEQLRELGSLVGSNVRVGDIQRLREIGKLHPDLFKATHFVITEVYANGSYTF